MDKSVIPPDMKVIGTKEGYDLWSEVYDGENNPLIMLEEPLVDEQLGSVSGKTLLELGCGTGRQSNRLASLGAKVTALDQSEGMLQQAKNKRGAEGVDYICHDVSSQLPFEDSSFDVVTSFLVLDHIENLRAFMKESTRVCKKDGLVLISSMHPAMNYVGVQARFKPEGSQTKIAPQSFYHQVSDYVNAALEAGLTLEHFSEHFCTREIVEKCGKKEFYFTHPLLLLLKLKK